MTAFGSAEQRANACFVDDNIGRIEPDDDFVGDCARVILAADSCIAAELPMTGKPPQEQDRRNRACEFEQFRRQDARPRTMSIIAVTGLRSYPASAACSANTAGWSPFDARANAQSRVERVPERQ